jgi:hypothetical protein
MVPRASSLVTNRYAQKCGDGCSKHVVRCSVNGARSERIGRNWFIAAGIGAQAVPIGFVAGVQGV